MDVRCASSQTAKGNSLCGKPARRMTRRLLLFFSLLGLCEACAVAAPLSSSVTVVDVDLVSGKTTFRGPDAKRASEPGSTLKPFVLLTALQSGEIAPHARIVCTGTLRLGSRNLACSHPNGLRVLDATEALAYSCNTYFALLASRMPSTVLQQSLGRFGIHTRWPAVSPEQRALLVLGLDDVSVTPLEIARAYVSLAKALERASPETETVRLGMLDSVQYGMARAAHTAGLELGGKTGTAHDPLPMVQHGWFAGIVFGARQGQRPSHVIVVYAPGGNGNDAAMAAHTYLLRRPRR